MTGTFRFFLLGWLVLAMACSKSSSSGIPPTGPESTIHSFMNAVAENDLEAMGQLWGTKDGPAATNMEMEELNKRLTVIRSYLNHESYQVIPGAGGVSSASSERSRFFRVSISRRGCEPVIPIEMVWTGAAWLVQSVDLTAAGNPARRCDR